MVEAVKRTPMSRGSGFKRPERARAEPAPLRPLVRPVTYFGTTGDPLPKEEAARPGKGAATVEERGWLDAIVAFGCVACWLDKQPPRPTAVHHILRGGLRMGHLHSLPLCHPGHHIDGHQFGLISRHPWKTRFEERYGTEAELLAMLRKELGYAIS